jgi:hypothetical protein
MAVESPSLFAQVIQDHLELKRRNAALDSELPLDRYMTEDPFDNHPLFKTEEQARVEDTMDGEESIIDTPTALDWPTTEDTFIEDPIAPAAPAAAAPVEEEPAAEPDAQEESGENLWSRSRDFDWGD